MLGDTSFVCGPAGEALSETNLQALYGVDLRRLRFDHQERSHETLVPILPDTPRTGVSDQNGG